MTETIPADASIDPVRLFEDGRVETDRLTYTHGTADHCEASAAGRAIAGVTDDDGRVLLAVHPTEEHVILPNAVVDPGEDWVAAVREQVEGMTGVRPTIGGIERVRRVDHEVEGEDGETTHGSVTHHVVFAASPSSTELDGLCADNEWELGWYHDLPPEADDRGDGVFDDLRLFFDRPTPTTDHDST